MRKFIVAICALSCTVFISNVLSEESIFIGNFDKWALTINVADVGPIIGETDLEVKHPFWVSVRPRNIAPKDPTNSIDIAAAWATDTFTNMKDIDGNLIPGATVRQEWVGVSHDEAATLIKNGFAIIGSSAGFMFALIRQQVSLAATTAFGLHSIDNGSFIRAVDTVQGVCG